jgi:hypothetical protein
MLLRLFWQLFLCLLYGACRFICLLGAYASFVDWSPSLISSALILAIRDVSECRTCIGFTVFVVCFRSACLLFKFRMVPRLAGCRCWSNGFNICGDGIRWKYVCRIVESRSFVVVVPPPRQWKHQLRNCNKLCWTIPTYIILVITTTPLKG